MRNIAILFVLLLTSCAVQPGPQQMWAEDQAACRADEGTPNYQPCLQQQAQYHAIVQQQNASRRAAMMQAGIAMATPPPPPAPMPSILPPPPVNCTSSRDYMGQVHTVCR